MHGNIHPPASQNALKFHVYCDRPPSRVNADGQRCPDTDTDTLKHQRGTFRRLWIREAGKNGVWAGAQGRGGSRLISSFSRLLMSWLSPSGSMIPMPACARPGFLLLLLVTLSSHAFQSQPARGGGNNSGGRLLPLPLSSPGAPGSPDLALRRTRTRWRRRPSRGRRWGRRGCGRRYRCCWPTRCT